MKYSKKSRAYITAKLCTMLLLIHFVTAPVAEDYDGTEDADDDLQPVLKRQQSVPLQKNAIEIAKPTTIKCFSFEEPDHTKILGEILQRRATNLNKKNSIQLPIYVQQDNRLDILIKHYREEKRLNMEENDGFEILMQRLPLKTLIGELDPVVKTIDNIYKFLSPLKTDVQWDPSKVAQQLSFKVDITAEHPPPVESTYCVDEDKIIGQGNFGAILFGVSQDGIRALKLSFGDAGAVAIVCEAKAYKTLSGKPGFPEFYSYGSFYRKFELKDGVTVRVGGVLAMELLGSNLQDLFYLRGRKFSLKCTLYIAYQLFMRLSDIHSLDMVHNDMKPDNIMTGPRPATENGDMTKYNTLYLVDFGVFTKILEIGKSEEAEKALGTLRFLSRFVHSGKVSGPRDDLEALWYMLMLFLRGSLPWDFVDVEDYLKKFPPKNVDKKLENVKSKLNPPEKKIENKNLPNSNTNKVDDTTKQANKAHPIIPEGSKQSSQASPVTVETSKQLSEASPTEAKELPTEPEASALVEETDPAPAKTEATKKVFVPMSRPTRPSKLANRQNPAQTETTQLPVQTVPDKPTDLDVNKTVGNTMVMQNEDKDNDTTAPKNETNKTKEESDVPPTRDTDELSTNDWEKAEFDATFALKEMHVPTLADGFPAEFTVIKDYMSSLRIRDKPNYEFLQLLISSCLERKCNQNIESFNGKQDFDWNRGLDKFANGSNVASFTYDHGQPPSDKEGNDIRVTVLRVDDFYVNVLEELAHVRVGLPKLELNEEAISKAQELADNPGQRKTGILKSDRFLRICAIVKAENMKTLYNSFQSAELEKHVKAAEYTKIGFGWSSGPDDLYVVMVLSEDDFEMVQLTRFRKGVALPKAFGLMDTAKACAECHVNWVPSCELSCRVANCEVVAVSFKPTDKNCPDLFTAWKNMTQAKKEKFQDADASGVAYASVTKAELTTTVVIIVKFYHFALHYAQKLRKVLEAPPLLLRRDESKYGHRGNYKCVRYGITREDACISAVMGIEKKALESPDFQYIRLKVRLVKNKYRVVAYLDENNQELGIFRTGIPKPRRLQTEMRLEYLQLLASANQFARELVDNESSVKTNKTLIEGKGTSRLLYIDVPIQRSTFGFSGKKTEKTSIQGKLLSAKEEVAVGSVDPLSIEIEDAFKNTELIKQLSEVLGFSQTSAITGNKGEANAYVEYIAMGTAVGSKGSLKLVFYVQFAYHGAYELLLKELPNIQLSSNKGDLLCSPSTKKFWDSPFSSKPTLQSSGLPTVYPAGSYVSYCAVEYNDSIRSLGDAFISCLTQTFKIQEFQNIQKANLKFVKFEAKRAGNTEKLVIAFLTSEIKESTTGKSGLGNLAKENSWLGYGARAINWLVGQKDTSK